MSSSCLTLSGRCSQAPRRSRPAAPRRARSCSTARSSATGRTTAASAATAASASARFWSPRSASARDGRAWEDRRAMPTLSPELRQLIETGPLVHLSTVNADGSPQVSVIWIELDGDDLITSHMSGKQLKLRNIDRDPRVVLSFDAPREPGVFLAHHAGI